MQRSYQLKTLRPTAAFTVPPSTMFATRPVSYYPEKYSPPSQKSKQKQKALDQSIDIDESNAGTASAVERITLVGVDQGEAIKVDNKGKIIWLWRGDDSEKEVFEVSLYRRGRRNLIIWRLDRPSASLFTPC